MTDLKKQCKMEHKDFNFCVMINKLESLKEVNVGDSLNVMSVNRKTGEITLNRYSFKEWETFINSCIAEAFDD